MKKHILTVLLLTVSLFAVCAQGTKESTASKALAPASKKTITVAVQSFPQTSISAMSENSNVAIRIDYSIEETLVKTDYRDGGKFKPGLAESWEVVDPRHVIFHLRKGVKFHDGTDFKADDVVYTFGPERLMNKSAAGLAVAGPFLGGIESVKALDDYTVEVTSKMDDALLLTRFASYPSQIVSKDSAEKKSFEEFSLMPVGTGPYKITKYDDSVEIVLEKFDDYWDASNKAASDKIVFKYVPELSTRIAGLTSGEFDLITEVPSDQAQAIEKMKGIKVVGGPIQNIYGMFFDTTNDTFMQYPKFRQALTVAIDRKKLVASLFNNLTTIPKNWQSESFGDMFLADYPGVAYDPTLAKQLLKECGYNGEPVVYRSLPGYYTLEQTVAEAVVQMWKEVGINVDLQIKENWTQIMADDNDRNIYNGSFSAYYPDPVGQFWRRFSDVNAAGKGFDVPKDFVELGHVLEQNPDLQVRRDTFKKMLDMFQTNPNGMYLYNLPMIYAESENIDWSPLPIEGMDFTVNSVKGL
ncbi:ABC transporter substrate-binding protein [uncultured Sphaerochaeta sp.]|uniref:ABC transporter substrate-binding protein n=1 Tax=uncultured Sphaerochaeta sp. TaxID=886478 RepID=UPI002A0A88A9|nr:ABC transporter substrate-binding protein [uncultured Sphaerochaeta sp.]